MHTLEEIHSELTRSVSEIAGIPLERLEPDKDLVRDLGIDSLSMVEIMVVVQDKFGVVIPDSELHGLPTVDDVASYIHRQQG